MLRAQLLQLIRDLGLSHSLDNGRYLAAKWRNAAANRQFRKQYPAFDLPPDYLLYEAYRINYASYRRTGLQAAQWIHDHFTQWQPDVSQQRILDWGCGPGRVLRHLPTVFGSDGTYYGVDPNPQSVRWCQEHLANANTQVLLSEAMPPLPLSAASIDLLYGISILTHLSAAAHHAWLAEIARVLTPGGLALITTHGPAYLVKLTPKEQIDYQQGKLIERGKVREGHRVFTAYQPPAYVRKLLQADFKVANYIPGQPRQWGIEQDTWIIQKR